MIISFIKTKKIKTDIIKVIENVEAAKRLSDVRNLKKLKGFKHYYRIRLGDYRIGIERTGNKLAFITILQRKDIYKKFP